MFRFILPFAIMATVVHADEQQCFDYATMDKNNEQYNQVLIFSSDAYKFVNGDMVAGEVAFYLNTTEGHWTMYSKYKPGEVCIEAYGDNFKDKYEGN